MYVHVFNSVNDKRKCDEDSIGNYQHSGCMLVVEFNLCDFNNNNLLPLSLRKSNEYEWYGFTCIVNYLLTDIKLS